jgi:autotransporter-associated beta strand protein
VVAKSGALGVGNKTVLVNTGNSMPELHLDGSMGDIVLGTNILFETSNSTAGSIHNIKGTNTIMGSFLFTSGNSFSLFNSRADKLYMTGNMKAKEVNRELHLRGNGDGEISGVIADGVTTNMPVYRDGGSGTWTLSGSNTYNGATSISSGTLAAGSDQAFGTNVVNLTGGNLGGAVGMWSITNTVNAQNNAGIIT